MNSQGPPGLNNMAPGAFLLYPAMMAVAQLQKTMAPGGVEVVRFFPGPQMQLFAMLLYCDKELRVRTPEAILEAAGLPRGAYDKFLEYEPYFSEWLEERRLALGGKKLKAALEMVGTEQALRGEFNFWKPLAIREGVIGPDKLEIGASLPANLGAYREMKPDDLKALENSVLADLRADADTGTINLAQGPQGWERKSDPSGAAEVSESVVLAPELGGDRERTLRELESF